MTSAVMISYHFYDNECDVMYDIICDNAYDIKHDIIIDIICIIIAYAYMI
jgi:hypothetical protein